MADDVTVTVIYNRNKSMEFSVTPAKYSHSLTRYRPVFERSEEEVVTELGHFKKINHAKIANSDSTVTHYVAKIEI